MALFTVKVNGGNEYRVLDYKPTSFTEDPRLKLITADYQSVLADFSEIDKLEIYAGGNYISSFTVYDTLSSHSIITNEFYEDENRFVTMIEITLVKSNLSEVVDKIERQLNPVVDVSSMTLDEYKEYVLDQVRIACNEDVTKGDYVTLPDGTSELFTWKTEDQQNVLNAVYICDKLVAKGVDLSEIKLPYHSSGMGCKLYPALVMEVVYTTLFIRSVKLQTYCNALNMLVKAAKSKEELDGYYYGMKLPEEVQAQVDELVAAALALAEIIMPQEQ